MNHSVAVRTKYMKVLKTRFGAWFKLIQRQSVMDLNEAFAPRAILVFEPKLASFTP